MHLESAGNIETAVYFSHIGDPLPSSTFLLLFHGQVSVAIFWFLGPETISQLST